MTRYISKGDWFDKDAECELIMDCSMGDTKMGIFAGPRGGTLDEELCPFDEFDVIGDEFVRELA